MAFVFLIVLFLLINVYIARRLLGWLKAISDVFQKRWVSVAVYLIYAFLNCFLIFSFVMQKNAFTRIVAVISNYWMGIFAYTLMILLIIDLLKIIGKYTKIVSKDFLKARRTKVITGTIALAAVVIICGYGIYHAHQLQTADYQVTVEKTVNGETDLTIALVSDLHLGYNIGLSQMEEVVDKVNAMNADIICLAGDIFDNDYEALEDEQKMLELFKEFNSKYGVYACFGNHDVDYDIQEGLELSDNRSQTSNNRMVQFLEKADVTLLRDEAMLIDDKFYMVGRLDYRPIGVTDAARKSVEHLLSDLDKNKPIIVLDHQPVELEALEQNGADIVLSGHTHNGQISPGNLIVQAVNENGYGYLEKGNMHSIVTSGAGLWGPYLRVGSDSEIVKIDVNYQ